MNAGEITFCERDERCNFEVRELRTQGIVEAREFLGAAVVVRAVVENRGIEKEFEDRFTTAAVPNFVKPVNHQLFVLFRSGKGLGSGRPPGKDFRQSIRRIECSTSRSRI